MAVLFSTAGEQSQWSGVLGVILENALAPVQQDWGLATALVRAGANFRALDLHEAVAKGQGELALALLENGAPVDHEDRRFQTPLFIAAREDMLEMVQLLLQKGADVHKKDEDQQTPLHVAAEHGCDAVVRVLMDAGASCGVQDFGRGFPLERAVENGHVDVVRVMMQLGVDVVASVDGFTPLHFAKTSIMMNVLLGAGADIEARDSNGKTPLNFNMENSGVETTRALVDHGADVDAQDDSGDTPLHSAVHAGPDIVAFLLGCGADETKVNVNGQTPADTVAAYGDPANRGPKLELMLRMLASAPADRIWRRRGPFLLCVARNGREPRPMALGDWGGVAAWVQALRLGNEGIFRTTVGFL